MLMILSGGGGFAKNPDAYRLFADACDKTRPVLYVALSQTPENALGHYPAFVSLAASLGIFCTRLCPDAGFIKNIDASEYGGIFVDGGNTFRLLASLKGQGADAKLRELVRSGVPYLGTSAGAIIAGADIMPIIYMDAIAVCLDDTRGLDMIGGWSTVAHYGDSKSDFVNAERNAAVAKLAGKFARLVALSEESAIVVRDSGAFIQGADCTVFENGTPRVIPSGGKLA